MHFSKDIVSTPCLTTALNGPLQLIEESILTNQCKIEAWFREQWLQTPAPFYSSVDLRNSGFKLAPVDTNLFPAGFNNLNPDFLPLCIQAVQSMLEKKHARCLKILLVPENHSRNVHYYESLAVLFQILVQAGYDVRIGSLLADLTSDKKVSLPSGKEIVLSPIFRKENRLHLDGFDPCLILLNNDLSEGVPAIFQNLEQAILPALNLGWSTRLKTNHFAFYRQIAQQFAELINIDPWLIDPYFDQGTEIDFFNRQGDAVLAEKVSNIYAKVQSKYEQYNIDRKPFIVVKANAGTYGMGVMMVDDPEEITQLNRKERTKMSSSKGGQKVDNVMIQEGVYTFETIGSEASVAEPVIYMIGQHVVGGFYRVHTQKSDHENLNAPGMQFVPLAFASACNMPDLSEKIECQVNRFYTYGVIARLAALAAAQEIAAVN